MITFKHPDHHRAPPEARRAEPIETDPVAIIARAMVELDAAGQTVNAESLGERTGLTDAEIEANWRAARDEARRTKRERGGYRRAA